MAKMATGGVWIALATVIALAAGVVEKYSANRRGAVVETRPVALVATMGVKSGAVAETTSSGAEPFAGDGAKATTAKARRTSPSPQVRVTEANAETHAIAEAEAARVRPIRPTPRIVRVTSWHCAVVAPGAWLYQQGGIARPVTAPFPCPLTGVARERWGSGTRDIVIEYADGETAIIIETWPTEVVR